MTDVYEFPDGKRYDAYCLSDAEAQHDADIVMHQAHTGLPTSGDARIDHIREGIQDLVNDGYRYLAATTYTDTPETPALPIEGGYGTSVHRNGYPTQTAAGQAWDTRGLGVAGVLLVIALCIMTCAGMMLFDDTISFVR